jgi:hypothetical protein
VATTTFTVQRRRGETNADPLVMRWGRAEKPKREMPEDDQILVS